MGVIIDGVEYDEYIREQQEELLDEFNVIQTVTDIVKAYLPSDISYFDNSKINKIFEEIKKADGKSEDYAYALSCIILNIGTACRIPYSLEKAYLAHMRYTGSILTYFNKYKSQLSVVGKQKIARTIERQFKHFEINPVKAALQAITFKQVPLDKVPMWVLNISPKSLPGKMYNAVSTMVEGWLAYKYYDMLEAVRMYKKAAEGRYEISDPQSVYISQRLKKEAAYFYDVAYRALNDMLKVYDQV